MDRKALRDLLEQSLRGDRNAFGEFYEQLLDRVFRYVVYRVGNQQDAEDLVEEVFVKAWEALHRSRTVPDNPEAWIYRIAHNAVIDYHRTRKSHASIDALPSLTDRMRTPEEQAVAAGEVEQLAQALRKLPPIYQQVLVCRFIQGMSHREVAEVLGTNENHVRVLQHRALKRLRAVFAEGDHADE